MCSRHGASDVGKLRSNRVVIVYSICKENNRIGKRENRASTLLVRPRICHSIRLVCFHVWLKLFGFTFC